MTRLLVDHSVWWQLRTVNPDGQDDGWLSWDHELERPYRFDTNDEAFAALETFKRNRREEDDRGNETWATRNGGWFLAEGWSGRVVRVVQDLQDLFYYNEEYPDGDDTF